MPFVYFLFLFYDALNRKAKCQSHWQLCLITQGFPDASEDLTWHYAKCAFLYVCMRIKVSSIQEMAS